MKTEISNQEYSFLSLSSLGLVPKVRPSDQRSREVSCSNQARLPIFGIESPKFKIFLLHEFP